MCCFTVPQKTSKEEKVALVVKQQADSFMQFINHVFLPAVERNDDNKQLQADFLQARQLYKKFEWAAEYFTPSAARLFNGAPVPSIEQGSAVEPQGLQVIEALLYPVYDSINKPQLQQQLRLFSAARSELAAYFDNISVLTWQVFDAVKLEVFRVETLGITGFDVSIAQGSIAEAACNIASLQNIVALYASDVNPVFGQAIQYLNQHPGFNAFNRAVFLREYANPLTIVLTRLPAKLHLPDVAYSRFLRPSATTLFDTGAFDVIAYAPGLPYAVSAKQIALGEALFKDPVLSGIQQRSCASCHNPAKAFADGLVKNSGLSGHALLSRNTPTLLNAAFQPFQFYDMRVPSLEAQVMDVLQSREEMAAEADSLMSRLWASKKYRRLFSEAFPDENRQSIDTSEIAHAIAEYVRSLAKLNSRFDRYMRHKEQLTVAEINGFNLFMGKARCGTCHYMPLFNGVLPPAFTNEDPEVLGVPAGDGSLSLDKDEGMYQFIAVPFYHNAFKTPSVRNTTLTAPYMHNGGFATLKSVLDFYNDGGGAGRGIILANQTLPVAKLGLTEKETKDIIAFLGTLDSR